MFELGRRNLTSQSPNQMICEKNETETHCATGPRAPLNQRWVGEPELLTSHLSAFLTTQAVLCEGPNICRWPSGEHQEYPRGDLNSNPRANAMLFSMGKEKPQTRYRSIRANVLLLTLFQNKFCALWQKKK